MAASLMLLFAYLLGSIPSGFLLGSFAGIDIRQTGSGNVGATNVARVVGKRQGLITLLADVAKGLIPVLLSSGFDFDARVTVFAALAAFFGHLYPVFLKFRGGKGVATAAGVFLGFAPSACAALIFVFVLVMAASRRVSLASMTAAVAAPIVFWLLSYPPLIVGMALVIALAILLRHRENIRRLISGKEPKFQL